jgi:nucleotide-binding universal stress UspA family protein
MIPFQTILHPTDFSPAAEQAFPVACSLARDHNARLIVLHSVPPASFDFGELAPHECPEGYARRLWQDVRRLTHADPRLRDLDIESELVDGDPVRMILAKAEEFHCDLIVMGTHGRTGLSRLLVGSVAEAVMRKAPCPVLTVKGPAAEPMPVGAAEEEAVAAE